MDGQNGGRRAGVDLASPWERDAVSTTLMRVRWVCLRVAACVCAS